MIRLILLIILGNLVLWGDVIFVRRSPAAAATGLCDDIPQTGLQACWDALTTDNTEQTLVDETGNGKDCTRGADTGSSTDDPTWLDNDSDGEYDNLDYEDASSDDFLLCPGGSYGGTDLYPDGEDFTIFIAYNFDDNDEFSVLVSTGQSGGNAPVEININTFGATRTRIKGTDTNVENQSANSWALLWIQCDDGTTCQFCVNDETDANCDSLGTGSATDPNEQLSIGCGDEGGGTSCLDGQTTVFGVYDTYVSESDRSSAYSTIQTEHSNERNITL